MIRELIVDELRERVHQINAMISAIDGINDITGLKSLRQQVSKVKSIKEFQRLLPG